MNKLLLCLLMCVAGSTQAAISLGQTRVIYNENDKAATFNVVNNVDEPYMVQTWLDRGNPDETPTNLPMLVTPPILKLDGHKAAVLRTIYQGSGLPQDIESVLWINVQEIPTVSDTKNALQLAQRIRIKLFYRPAGLDINLPDAVAKLQWQCHGTTLRAINPTALHISLTQLHVNGRDVDADMVNPRAQRDFSLKQAVSGPFNFSWVDDYGAINTVSATCH